MTDSDKRSSLLRSRKRFIELEQEDTFVSFIQRIVWKQGARINK
jgi:hypothetical protein